MLLPEQLHISGSAELIHTVPAVENQGFIKPKFGFWTSSYTEETGCCCHGRCSAWVRWCDEERFGKPHLASWFVLAVDPAARILVIDSPADLKRMLQRHTQTKYFGIAYPDFESLAAEYDAVHLTEVGERATRLTIPTLYGWDTESTLWFRWRFSACRKIEPVKPKSLVVEKAGCTAR